jgi:hypothetical protein
MMLKLMPILEHMGACKESKAWLRERNYATFAEAWDAHGSRGVRGLAGWRAGRRARGCSVSGLEQQPRESLRVYVGGASSEIDRVEAFIKRVRAAGHHITFDWARDIRDSGKPANVGMTHTQRFNAWNACMVGVERADAVIILAPRNGRTTKGAWGEMAIYIAQGGVPIYVGHVDDTVMTAMCQVVDDDDAAFAALEAS